MPRYLYRITPTRPEMLVASTPDEDRVVADHFAYLQQHAAAGTVLLAGRTQTTDANSFGIIIFDAPDDAAAEAFVAADPSVAGGVMDAALFPYRVAIGGHIEAG